MRSALLVVLAGLLLAGCTGDDQPAAKPEPKIIVGAGLSAEQQIIARMYGQALDKAGFDVTVKLDARRPHRVRAGAAARRARRGA